MSEVQAAMLGLAMGVVGALPPAVLFELALRKTRPVSVAAGIASIFVSFVTLIACTYAVYLFSPQNVLFFGVAEAVSFLMLWAIEAWRAWWDANHPAGPRERNRGESAGKTARGD